MITRIIYYINFIIKKKIIIIIFAINLTEPIAFNTYIYIKMFEFIKYRKTSVFSSVVIYFSFCLISDDDFLLSKPIVNTHT